MKQRYKKQRLFDLKKLGQLFFTLFVVFVAYKILTPPSDETARIESPDGSKTARLRTIYYLDNQPSYKVDYRDSGKRTWLRLLHLPSYTNAPPESHNPSIGWSPDSRHLLFKMNGTSIWHHTFEQ
ncbi:MAG: hypothetical protein ABFR47_07190 [Verrucomicrobiota bacterium]